jgi:mycothione reductase
MIKHYDIIVIGAGSGLRIADKAAKHGLKVALIEKGPFGGTCVNRGCVPSKMLVYPSDIVQTMHEAGRLNISVKSIQPSFSDLVNRVSSTVDALSEKIQEHYVQEERIDVYQGSGQFIDERTIQVNDVIVKGEKVCLVIGARPKIPKVEGLEGTPYLTSTTALRHSTPPKKTAIIGGGFIAAELGHFYSSMGTEVEIFSRSGFVEKIDDTLRHIFIEAFRKSHTIHEFTSVYRIAYENGTFTLHFIDSKGQKKTSSADALLIAVGMQAWTDTIGMENTSIKIDNEGYIQVNDHLKTNGENTWALGDCIGHHLFRHMANFEADYVARQILEQDDAPISYPPIPFALFSHPQMGVVGKTEQQLKNEGIKYFVGTAEYSKSDMGKARRSTIGLVKLIFEKDTRRLLSAHILGGEAATMIHIPIAFIKMRATLEDMIETIYIHPALPEIISSAAFDAIPK